MSAFGSIATESADSENQNQQTAMPEDETATSELAEATAEHSEVAAEDDTAEQLGEEQEQVEDLGETIAEEHEDRNKTRSRIRCRTGHFFRGRMVCLAQHEQCDIRGGDSRAAVRSGN